MARYRKGSWRQRGKRLLLILIIWLIILFVLFLIAEKRMEPTLMLIATQKADQMAKLAITDAVTKRLTQQGVDFDEIIVMEKDKEGKIMAVNFNFEQYSRIVGETTSRIQNRMKEFEEENVKIAVPLGLATKSVFLEHYGPKIPVSLVPVGSVKTRLETGMEQAGINMVLVTVYINVEVNLRIVIPFATEQKTVTTMIPITEAIIVGKVPDYLYNNPYGKPDVPYPQSQLKPAAGQP
ncbi:sporulation protein YunB [Brevibacillus ruminantium]|uniref:Sporulation protein YunB n=1 Tax=Brevibacillus ruminantium TaxID=2950604 RepID=A0ABY4WGI6_9BACL|nr:sporulation protein YunB [Brevibacillus ruminantium]USG66237.1 sporulation protein YunB [Brevibacillus ruminantium]